MGERAPSVLSVMTSAPPFPPRHETRGDWLIVSNASSSGGFITAIKLGARSYQ